MMSIYRPHLVIPIAHYPNAAIASKTLPLANNATHPPSQPAIAISIALIEYVATASSTPTALALSNSATTAILTTTTVATHFAALNQATPAQHPPTHKAPAHAPRRSNAAMASLTQTKNAMTAIKRTATAALIYARAHPARTTHS
jgi:hypothetical protein